MISRCSMLVVAVFAFACSSPTSPTSTAGPGALRPRVRWEGTLTRAGESATISLTLDELPPATTHAFLLGAFTATYPSVTYSGTAAAFTDRDEWSLNLMPFVNRPCSEPLTTVHGTTVAVMTVTASRMTGEATLVECEGRTTWTAEFVRR
jgi:hypothetical protein